MYEKADKKRREISDRFNLDRENFKIDRYNIQNKTNIPKPFGGKNETDLKMKAMMKKYKEQLKAKGNN